ncbi:MAG: hypothetical protein HYT98_01610 [Candidatus Sungbacteria bacterium]|nr:hypothetical protein [Candidatus Sungbacteria bacterium]
MISQSISLIGMSNVGKSHWREKIAPLGFTPFCCDDLIEKKLEPYLRTNGFHGIEDIAKWMGQPYDQQYPANSALYLKKEAAVMKEIIRELRKGRKRLIIDTTGSVIYLEEKILDALRKLSIVVLLDTPENFQQELYRKYLLNPKPVIWGDAYQPLPGENPKDALTRYYPLLLKSRNKMYRRHAQIILDYDKLRAREFNAQKFLEEVELLLGQK